MEDELTRLIRGSGQFTADLIGPDQLHGYVLRSPHAHAKIEKIETEAATSQADVVAVFTAEDLVRSGVGAVPHDYYVEQPDGSQMATPPNQALARDRVRHVGDAVAFIVATTRHAAESASDLIDVAYNVLPSVTSAPDAMAPTAPEIWPEAPGNISFRFTLGDREKTEAAFARADRIIKRRLTFPRIVVNPLETRAALAVPEREWTTLYTQTQGSQELRSLLARALGWAENDLHVVTPNVGGAFGIRCLPCPEHILVTHAARLLKRSVKWVGERSSDGFLGDNQARDQVFDVELATTNSGSFLGIRMETTANIGAKLSGYAPGNSTLVRRLPGPYDFPTGYCEVTAVFTNTVQVDSYRGAGRAELVFPLEMIIDAAAREIGLDPSEIRRRNFASTHAQTRTNCFGAEVENRDYLACFERAVAQSNWLNRSTETRDERSNNPCRGHGMASYAVPAAGGEERILLTVDDAGIVSVFTGTQSGGQGHESVFAHVVADELSIESTKVRVIQGDTRKFAGNTMTSGSRSIPAGVPACRKAAVALMTRGRDLVAALTQSESKDISYAAGVFRCAATGAEYGWGDLVVAASEAGLVNPEASRILAVEIGSSPGEFTAPCGTHVCEVEIDRATGKVSLVRYTSVDDIGDVAVPALATGQVHGGVAQGLGQALLETCSYDNESGQLLTGSMMDYALPRADDISSFTSLFMAAPRSSRLHGVGEMGTIASTPAILNAVNDALVRMGAEEIDAPVTSEKVWRACNLR